MTLALRRSSWFKKPHAIFLQFTAQRQHLNEILFVPKALPLLTLPAPYPGILSPAESNLLMFVNMSECQVLSESNFYAS